MSEFLTELNKIGNSYGTTTIHIASTMVEQRFPREVSTAMKPIWIGLRVGKINFELLSIFTQLTLLAMQAVRLMTTQIMNAHAVSAHFMACQKLLI
jgi:hypothetical protein